MALQVADRVQETTLTSGTGTLTLNGPVPGFQSFVTGIGTGNTTYYTIYDPVSYAWEVGIGTFTSGASNTLSRDTVLSNSLGTTAKINLVGNQTNVFVTYPSDKSVFLDFYGNVSPLGIVESGTWQGATVGVAYGGTGVTASSGANSVVIRDSNQNINVNSVTQKLSVTTSSGGTTVLTVGSAHFQVLTGTSSHTYQLPNATFLPTGSIWVFDNDSTGNLYVVNNASGAIDTVAPGGYATVVLETNGTIAGEWLRFGMVPSEVNWGTNNLDLGGATVVTNGTWQGTPIAYNYGGTGLTTYSAANYALYSTSASTLTAGTLPAAAGGTGISSYTIGDIVYANTTSSLAKLPIGASNQVLGIVGGLPSWTTIVNSQWTTSGSDIYYSLGNVGIGTSSPTTKLQINAQDGFRFDVGSSAKSYMRFGSASTGESTAELSYTRATGATAISVGSTGSTLTDRLIIDSNGNVGIGTSSPAAKLDVNGGIINRAGAGAAAMSWFGDIATANWTTTLGGYSLTFYNDSSTGNLGTGTISANSTTFYPKVRFTETGNGLFARGLAVGTTADPNTGGIYATGAITAYYSDERLKNISGKIENALDKLNALSGVYYTNNEVANEHGYTSEETQVGVIAQQVKAVMPEVVKAAPFDLDEKGNSKSGENYMTVQYERLVPLLIEAIKELKAEVDELKKDK